MTKTKQNNEGHACHALQENRNIGCFTEDKQSINKIPITVRDSTIDTHLLLLHIQYIKKGENQQDKLLNNKPSRYCNKTNDQSITYV